MREALRTPTEFMLRQHFEIVIPDWEYRRAAFSKLPCRQKIGAAFRSSDARLFCVLALTPPRG
jgi:hypothetical protein